MVLPIAFAEVASAGLTSGIGLFRVAASLAVCLALAVGAALLLKRFKLPRADQQTRPVHVQGITRLDSKTTIYVISCEEQLFLLAQGAQGMAWLPLQSSVSRQPSGEVIA